MDIDTTRGLVYEFLQLPYSIRWRIFEKLGLMQEADPGLNDMEQTQLALALIRERDLLLRLKEEVMAEIRARNRKGL